MKGSLTKICRGGFLCSFILLAYITMTSSMTLDLTELRNKVSKIKVNPRGNLWATGKSPTSFPHDFICFVFHLYLWLCVKDISWARKVWWTVHLQSLPLKMLTCLLMSGSSLKTQRTCGQSSLSCWGPADRRNRNAHYTCEFCILWLTIYSSLYIHLCVFT